jgi:hypothetical protein
MSYHDEVGADIDFRLMMDGMCDRSTGDANSSYAPDRIFGVSRGPCISLAFIVDCSIYLIWKLVLTADFPLNLTGRTDFDCGCSIYVIWTHDIDY